MTELVAIGQPVEKRPGGRIRVQRVCEIVGYRNLAWLVIQLQIDIDLIAGSDPSAGAVLAADRQHEFAAHRPHRAAVGIPAVQSHSDSWLLAGAKARDDVGRNLETGRRLSGEPGGAAASHARQSANGLG